MRPRKYKWCRDMLFSENLHGVACRGWYNFVETRRIWWTNWKLCSKLHIRELVCQNLHTVTSFCTVKTSHSAFASVKNNGKFPLRHVLIYVKSCTLYKSKIVQRCRMQNNEGVEHSASSDGAAVVVVVNIDRSQSFFVVNLLGQSFSCSYS